MGRRGAQALQETLPRQSQYGGFNFPASDEEESDEAEESAEEEVKAKAPS